MQDSTVECTLVIHQKGCATIAQCFALTEQAVLTQAINKLQAPLYITQLKWYRPSDHNVSCGLSAVEPLVVSQA